MHAEPLTPESLVDAIATLFRQNNYVVEGPLQIHGAEVDLVATPLGNPFASKVYIEATVEHVDNDKYGRDMGKLALIGEKEPAAARLIVSARGFSLPVRERARETRIETFTYTELFARFERFEPYINAVVDEGPVAEDLRALESVYEEPLFDDPLGTTAATEFLDRWRLDQDEQRRWLIVVGEYGTGKTALTRVLQYRWAREYRAEPSVPLPFRIELRDFTRQFDARGLVHHFLDMNQLGHLSIDFVFSLIRTGRVVLLLDGYDEMAQYLSARERRVCLEALADLSADGARGILTSRPNYFTEAEEFHVFDVLYSLLEKGTYFLTSADRERLERERSVDQLIERHLLERYERSLRDLTPEQTVALVGRRLADDETGRDVVLGILHRVFRGADAADAVSLSGKPVIIAYLLEVVEQLKESAPDTAGAPPLSEWDVYKLIIDQLMLRDLQRSARVMPDRRRDFLKALSLWLSRREHAVIDEQQFRDLVRREFRNDVKLRMSGERERELESYFDDLRSSSTLTRAVSGAHTGWRFSHNSLREYLLAELLLEGLRLGNTIGAEVPISEAMRLFVSSRGATAGRTEFELLAKAWPHRRQHRGIGSMLALLWDAVIRLFEESPSPARACLEGLSGARLSLDGIVLSRLQISTVSAPAELEHADFADGEFSDLGLAGGKLRGARFVECVLENVDFSAADLAHADFRRSFLLEVNFSGAVLRQADFRGLDDDSTILVQGVSAASVPGRLAGREAIGYLRYRGAVTDDIDPYLVYRHDPRFPVVEKIVTKLAEQRNRQRRGLVQRGAARQDIRFARSFLEYLEREGLVGSSAGHADVVSATSTGRSVFSAFADRQELPEVIERFLAAEAG